MSRNLEDGDGCDSKCQRETGWKCSVQVWALNEEHDHYTCLGTDTFRAQVGARSVCSKVVCGDGRIEESNDGSLVETCDDSNSEDGIILNVCQYSCASPDI